MPVANTTVAGPIKTVRYQESPLMSTYLVAIVVGFFEYVEGVTSKGIISVNLISLTLSIQIVE
jgi:puromycin-sensitive aminopeptidase